MRTILIRFAVPTIIAVSILAFFGVPYVDRILAEWFNQIKINKSLCIPFRIM